MALETLTDETRQALLDVENPLLKRFKLAAPKTYYHSERVQHFLEKIGRELKLDVELLKIIGIYHDIGKMRFPAAYCENQDKDFNLHDTLSTDVSANLIISHISNSISILITTYPNISSDIIRCISTHHGDRVLKSIYNKIDDKTTTDIELYKYPYERPSDVYSCSLMICDTVEATMRAFVSAGKVTIENTPETIVSIVKTLIDEKQLDTLSIGQHRTILDVLTTDYLSGEQKRISAEYEEDKNDGGTS